MPFKVGVPGAGDQVDLMRKRYEGLAIEVGLFL